MLSEEEELLVSNEIERLRDEPPQDTQFVSTSSLLQLFVKLREINYECSKYAEELEITNEELARFREHYEG